MEILEQQSINEETISEMQREIVTLRKQLSETKLASASAVVTLVQPMPDVPKTWILMNAARPLEGDMTLANGPFLAGCFYAALDPAGVDTTDYLLENIESGAKLVFVVDRGQLREMALQTYPTGLRARLLNSWESKKADPSDADLLAVLMGKTWGQLKAFENAVALTVEPDTA